MHRVVHFDKLALREWKGGRKTKLLADYKKWVGGPGWYITNSMVFKEGSVKLTAKAMMSAEFAWCERRNW